ncbi:MAG: hypothetical protein Q7S84_02075 [bacterium]|nr:hypothetical protein [bacterium]
MRVRPPRWTVSVPLALALGVAGVALYLVQVSRVLAIGSVNPNLILVLLVCIAALAPRFWVPVVVGGLILAASFLWTPFDVGSVALVVGITLLVAVFAPFFTGRSFADTYLTLASTEVFWGLATWRVSDPFFIQLRTVGIGFVLDAVLVLAVWYALHRVRGEG